MPQSTPHQVVKPEVLANTAVGLLEQELLVPNLFQKEGIDKFKGAEDDTVNVKVPGVLPARDYEWRHDRSTDIEFDDYAERKIAVKFGGNIVGATRINDEQNDMDLLGWSKLLGVQVKGVARGLGRRAVKHLVNAPYSVTIGGAEANLKAALIEARRVLNAFNVPDGERYIVVGTDFESAILNEDKFNLAQNVGDAEAASVLREATLGRKYGFTFIVDQTIPSDAAYAFVGSAFIFLNAAPAVPQSILGATASFEGVTMRWLRDYETGKFRERSVVNTYYGFDTVKDPMVGWDPTANGGNGAEFVSTGEHFVRGIKLTLGGTSVYPDAAGELAKITKISSAKAFVAKPAPSGAEG